MSNKDNEIIPIKNEPHNVKKSIKEKIFPGKAEKEQERLAELAEQVATKLLKDISEQGTIVLFSEKGTGKLTSAICRVYLKSDKIHCLNVEFWGESIPPTQSSMELHRQLFSKTQDRKFISAIENNPSKTRRAIAVVQSWDMPDNSYTINYRRNAEEEASNAPTIRSNREKINFL